MSKREIPESWAVTSLGVISEFKNGRAFKSSEWSKSGLPIIRIQNVNANDPTTTEYNFYKGEYDRSVYVETGDLLFCWSGSLGTSFGPRIWKGPPGLLNQHIFKVNLQNGIDKQFYYWQMIANLHLVEARAHGGVGLTHITKSELVKVEFFLPPMDEQIRLVKKIQSTKEKISSIENSISKAEELIEKYRESLLQKAFRGDLVPQDPKDEPASKLIERIHAEKEKQSIGRKKKKGELKSISANEVPFEVPQSWEWVCLGDILDESTIGIVRSTEQQSGNHKYPYIKMGDYNEFGYFNTSEFARVNADKHEVETYSVRKGDLLFNTRNSEKLVGKVALINNDPTEVTLFNNNLMRIRFKEISPDFIFWQFQSAHVKDQLSKMKSGTTSVSAIYGKDLIKLKIAVPPLPEQSRIVFDIKNNLKSINELKEVMNTIRFKLNELSSSILETAFLGKLVRQDSSEGTGKDLLEQLGNKYGLSQEQPFHKKQKKKQEKK